MASSSRASFTREEVLGILDSDSDAEQEDFDEDIFFPGSDDELGFLEEEVGDDR